MTGRSRGQGGRRILLLGLAWGVAGCARPQAPQGGVLPEVPLRAIETRPVHLSTVEPFEEAVVIRFAQVVSERLTQGALTDAVVVSPRTGEVIVEGSDDQLEVSMEGGFQGGLLYRITVLPRLQDRYQNSMEVPFDLLFSTGPAFEPNLVAGIASDGLTFEPVAEFRVDARVAGREEPMSAVADTAGIFSFPYLPSDAYTLIAYEDSNRDGEPGFNEIQDSVQVTVSPGDTLVMADFRLLEPDTTGAVLGEAEAIDSLAIRLAFDDYLDPDAPLAGVEATVTAAAGGTLGVSELLHPAEWEAREPEPEAPAPDSAAARDAEPEPDSLGAVDAVAEPDSLGAVDAVAEPDPVPPADPAVEPEEEGPPLPSRELIIILEAPLVPEETYELQVSGVTNMNGLPGGGGVVELTAPAAPPPPDPADAPGGADPPADSTDVPAPDAPPADSTDTPGPDAPSDPDPVP